MLRERPGAELRFEAPPTVRLVIAARLDHLDALERSVLHAASVVRDELDPRILGVLVGRGSEVVAAALAGLVQAGLVRRSPLGRGAGHDPYEFTHALIAEVAHGQLTRARCRALHRQTAEWLESEGPGGVDVLRAIAWHWGQVVALTRAEHGDVDGDLASRARVALVRAGERLLPRPRRFSSPPVS